MKPYTTERDEREQNILDCELADAVADSGRLPNAREINADGEEQPKHWTQHSEHEPALRKHLSSMCLITHGVRSGLTTKTQRRAE